MKAIPRLLGFFLLSLTFSLTLCAFAGTSGKIAGTVIDADSDEPLPGVNIVLKGTTMGAATDINGEYVILNVPPGIYAVEARMIGYKTVTVENVRVSIDLTSNVDFNLEETVLEAGEEITIVATRPMVVKDLTASTAVVDAENMKALPIVEVSDAIELQAGLVKDAGGGLHVRGGRSGEISYWIDGVPVTDVYDGGTVVEVNKNMVQELQVVSGSFNAEYGQAMSGIVNIATKDGDNQFGGSVSTYFGDYLSGHNDVFMNINSVSPYAIRNLEGSLKGAIIKDKLFYFINGRGFYNDGHLYGRREYYPGEVRTTLTLDEESINTFLPDYWDERRSAGNGLYNIDYTLGTNDFVDSIATVSNLPPEVAANPDSFNYYFNKLKNTHSNGRGDDAFVPMNPERKYYGQAKLIYRFTPQLKLSYNFIYDNVAYNDYQRNYQLNPDGILNRFRTGRTHILQATHALSSRTFYKAGVSMFEKEYQSYLYENINDPRYVHPNAYVQQPYSFLEGGTDNSRFERSTRTLLGKLDLTSQITNRHQIKAGIEVRQHRVYQRDINLRPQSEQVLNRLVFDGPFMNTVVLPETTVYHSTYNHQPFEFSAYLQDKMEFKNLIVNIGVRFDYFEPDGVVLADESDPMIYNPIKPQNIWHDWGSDGVQGTFPPDGTEGNGIWDPGEPAVTLEDRQSYWYKDATPKWQVSPRLGVSFPITERGVIYFSYGHFMQIPRFELLYQNPDFEIGSGTGNVGVIGNSDLKPEVTVSGEIGLQQQLGEDIALNLTGYFRDIRDLAGTNADEIVVFGGASKYSKIVNSDFGSVRGIILSLNKRFTGGFSASIDYTLQSAKASNSDPEQARNARAGGALPEVQLTPMDWDQQHTINSTMAYGGRSWGGSVLARWGSGLPYTPRRSQDISTLLTNSQTKPPTFAVDLRAFKQFSLGLGNIVVSARIFNLFDTLNEINVFDDTGRAGYTTDLETARRSNPPETINSLEEWFEIPTHWSEPRRVELGISFEF